MLITKTTLFTRFDASIFNVTKVYLHICILVKLIWILFSTTSKLILPTFRYSDFIVNEIDEEGKLVKLTNLDVDPTLIQAVCMSVSIHKVTGSRLCHDLSICMAIQKYYKYFELYDFRFIVMKIIQYCLSCLSSQYFLIAMQENLVICVYCLNDTQKDDPKTWYSRLVYVTLCMLIHLFHLGNTPLQIIFAKENILQIELPSKFWNDMYTQSGVTVMDWRVLMPLSVLSE